MDRNERTDDVDVAVALEEALSKDPAAEAIWKQLPEAHRRGHVVAVRRVSDPDERTQRIEHTIGHLLEKHA